MKRIYIIIILTSSFTFAQSAGNSGLAFLKFGFGARNIAMGDAGSSASNDLSALFYNPSRLASFKHNEVMFMHNEWIQDVRSEVGGVKWNMFNLPFAVGFNVTSVSDIEVRNKPGEPISKFNANYFFGRKGVFSDENYPLHQNHLLFTAIAGARRLRSASRVRPAESRRFRQPPGFHGPGIYLSHLER